MAKVTGVLPSTARNFGSAPKIANYLEYDVRYASFSTIAMVEGGPTADTLDDAAFIRFYGDRDGWDARRAYTIVAAEDPEKTCGLYNKTEHLFLSSKIDGAAQDYWGTFCVCVVVWVKQPATDVSFGCCAHIMIQASSTGSWCPRRRARRRRTTPTGTRAWRAARWRATTARASRAACWRASWATTTPVRMRCSVGLTCIYT